MFNDTSCCLEEAELALAPHDQCSLCLGRTSWDFLHEFYSRVDAAQAYAARLEHEVHEANCMAQSYQSLLRHCEAALTQSISDLDEERLEHRGTIEALAFERQRHEETTTVLEAAFQAAKQSGEIADNLRDRICASTPYDERRYGDNIVLPDSYTTMCRVETVACGTLATDGAGCPSVPIERPAFTLDNSSNHKIKADRSDRDHAKLKGNESGERRAKARVRKPRGYPRKKALKPDLIIGGQAKHDRGSEA